MKKLIEFEQKRGDERKMQPVDLKHEYRGYVDVDQLHNEFHGLDVAIDRSIDQSINRSNEEL
jgi:hypothetical protein